MTNPYAQTFMLATRLDTPRMHDVHPPTPARPAARAPRRAFRWFRRTPRA